MLDHFTIFMRSGAVLWSRTFTPTGPAANEAISAVDSLVRGVLVEERGDEQRWEKDSFALQWTFANELELVFVVVYQRILQLSYIPELLARSKALFLELFTPFLKALLSHTRGSAQLSVELSNRFASGLKEWESRFTALLRELERGSARQNFRSTAKIDAQAGAAGSGNAGQQEDAATVSEEPEKTSHNDAADVAKNVEALKARLKAAELASKGGSRGGAVGGKKGKKGKGAANGADTPGTSGTESAAETPGKKKKAPSKEMRIWEDGKLTDRRVNALDYSKGSSSGTGTPTKEKGKGDVLVDDGKEGSLQGWVDAKSLGTRTAEGGYEVADVRLGQNDEEDDQDEWDESTSKGGFLARFAGLGSSGSSNAGFFSRLTGSHALTEEDVAPALSAMQAHLQSKNVAADVAQRLCASVSKSLVGRQLGSFGSVKTEVRKALEESITRILTPKSSTDILVEIGQKKQRGLAAIANNTTSELEPYSMAFVGVNGVGKSTSLAKVCFWLLQNRLRVLIAACDTFRSGAVEQLRVHVKNLGQLEVGGEKVGNGTAEGKKKLELYERGYGKDAAGIAKEALAYAKKERFDVVVIDSAGRQQGNEPLMRALAKLVSLNNPDKVIFVGEAIVGNEALAQVKGFDQALKNFATVSAAATSGSVGFGGLDSKREPRGLDALLLTKWDAVADQVGTALTITSATGLAIALIGTGQTYTDLRRLRVAHIVDALMRQ
ncbi:signal recognition particle receptor alpha chain [Ceraceosorus bombacis]|uniref:Signal recognition particle receptor subunit alpha homolog n=1 Tax=Ceraceosorus bombacis TaxID=401625 RepID=A0A0P1BI68_9BASI|nr:signal recognition particle receptor alpha chain [Ceraceosorus bombacis]